MQISSRFTIAIHIFACIDYFGEDYKLTSDFLAGSVNVNPVVIRRLLQQLKAAGLINVARGSGGTTLAKPLKDISLLDVYQAVECVENGELFHFHDNPNPACPVGRNIHQHGNVGAELIHVIQLERTELNHVVIMLIRGHLQSKTLANVACQSYIQTCTLENVINE